MKIYCEECPGFYILTSYPGKGEVGELSRAQLKRYRVNIGGCDLDSLKFRDKIGREFRIYSKGRGARKQWYLKEVCNG